ncbi:MAG: ATP synthase subunit C [Nitrososphaeria archaeon]
MTVAKVKVSIRNFLMRFTFGMVRQLTGFKKAVMLITAFNLLVVFPAIIGISYAVDTPSQSQTSTGLDLAIGLGMLAAGLAIAGSCIGAGIAVGYAASAGAAAIVERPGAFGFILILAGLGEGIAIYGLLIAFQILGKIPSIP